MMWEEKEDARTSLLLIQCAVQDLNRFSNIFNLIQTLMLTAEATFAVSADKRSKVQHLNTVRERKEVDIAQGNTKEGWVCL